MKKIKHARYILLILSIIFMTINSNCEAMTPKYRDIAEIFKVQLSNATKLPDIYYIDESQFDKNNNKDAYVIFISKKQKLDIIDLPFDNEAKDLIRELIEYESFDGESDKIIHNMAKINGKFAHIFIAGIGEIEEINFLKIEKLGKKISNKLNAVKAKNILISYNLPNLDQDMAASLTYSFLANHFRFSLKNHFKKPEDKEQNHLVSAAILVNKKNIPALNKILEEKKALVKAKNISKSYCNGAGNIIYPESLANFVKEDLDKLGLKVTILETKEIRELGMGALLGVAMASDFPPRFVIIEWNGGIKGSKPLAFVGKGVTFDSGGLSIKPGDSMETMKYDMSGAATVAGVMRVLAERKAKVNVVGIMAIVENAIAGNAQRPDDVVLSMSGQTIEVLNTDAEGRLILADALTYVQQKHDPMVIVDLATLTGACIVALGNNIYAGLMSNNDDLATKLLDDGRKTGEKLWRLPLDEEYNKAMDSKIADMQNIGKKGFGAGTITAAEFLQRFIDKNRPWAHLDIAGVDNRKFGDETSLHGSTGFGIRLLNEFAKKYEQ